MQTAIDGSQDWATWSAGDGLYLGDFSIVGGTNDPPEHEWGMLANSMFAYLYPHTRGAATSLKGRAANSAGVIADIPAATLGHVPRRDATPAISFGTMLAGGFATGPGVITPAMMDNGTARSVCGRSANSSGARADIAGTGTAAVPQVLTDDGSTCSFTAFSTVRAAASVIYEVNYALLANNTLADGAESIDGLAHTAANMGELGTAAVQLGTGIRLIVATSNGGASTFTSSSQPAAHVYTTLGAIPNYDPTAEYIIEFYCPSIVLETTGETLFFGLWGLASSPYASGTPSAVRMRLVKLLNNAGTRVLQSLSNVTTQDSDIAIPTHNVFGIRVTPNGLGQAYSGVWSSGWPTLVAGPCLPTLLGGRDLMNSPDVRLVFGIGTANDASPTTAVTIERMRIRRVA